MKKAQEIVQYFNKSTQATKKLKNQQHESSLTKYSGQPKNILQDVKTRWWSTYRMLKRLRFLREAISHYFVDYPGYYSPRVEDLLPDRNHPQDNGLLAACS